MARNFNGLQQADVAKYLDTTQVPIAQIEAGRYKPNPIFAQMLAELFSLNYDFLISNSPPVFSQKVMLFTLPPQNVTPKMLNQIHSAIRKSLPSFCATQKINNAWAFSCYFREGWRELLSSVFFLFSSEFKQLTVIRVIEDKERLYFSLKYALGDILHDTIAVKYGDYENFFEERLPFSGIEFSDKAISQFSHLISQIDIPDSYEYISAFQHIKPIPLLLEKELEDSEKALFEEEQKKDDAIKGIVSIMKNHGITIDQLSKFFERKKPAKK